MKFYKVNSRRKTELTLKIKFISCFFFLLLENEKLFADYIKDDLSLNQTSISVFNEISIKSINNDTINKREKLVLISQIGGGNYLWSFLDKAFQWNDLNYDLYAQVDKNVMVLYKKFFIRPGFSVAFTEISTVVIGSIDLGLSGINKMKTDYRNIYCGIFFANHSPGVYDKNSKPTFNFNRFYIGFDLGTKFNKNFGMEWDSKLLFSSPFLMIREVGSFGNVKYQEKPFARFDIYFSVKIFYKFKRKKITKS